MSRYRTCKTVFAVGLALLAAGDRHPHDSSRAGPEPTARADPVLHDDDEARTVIDKALHAHGGEKSFARWKCGYVKYRTKGGIVPSQFGEVTLEDTFQLPGHFKRE